MLNFLKYTLNVVSFLLRRLIILYILMGAVSFYIFNQVTILDRRRAEELNEIMPDFGYIHRYEETQGEFDAGRLDAYIKYYEKVNEYLPNSADVYSMLGFCYYHKKEVQKAIDAYTQAITINPHIFWFHYNLGIIYYKLGKYEEAVKYLKAAIDKKPEHALMFTGYSRVYRRITRQADNYKEVLESRVRWGYNKCFALLVLSHYQLKQYPQTYGVASYALRATTEYKDFFYYYAGVATFKTKEYSKSVYFLRESVKLNPSNRDALFHLSLGLRNLGAEEMAAIMLKRILSMRNEEERPLLKGENIFIEIF